MAKQIVVALNEMQIERVADLRAMTNKAGYINGNAVRDGFKMNVLNALIRRGVLVVLRNDHYRVAKNVQIVLFQRQHKLTSRAGIAYAARLAAEAEQSGAGA